MARRVLIAATLVLLVAGVMPANVQAGERSGYIVVLKDSVSDPGAVARDHAARHGATVTHVYRHALKGYAASIPESRLAALRSDARVAAINVDAPVHALGHTAGNAPTGIHRTFAPDNANIDIDGVDDRRVDVDIAIIDTGIDIDHPDLNVVGGYNCQKGTTYDDGNGHGTHVAGSAAGLDNGNGVVGMAPGARLHAVRVLDNSGSGSWSSVICGVDWVTANSGTIEVANMSLGGSGSEPSGDGCSTGSGLHDAICKSVGRGVTYAVAAGNSSADAKDHVPAAYDEVMTVSALADFDGVAGGLGAATCRTDGDDTFAGFSNYGDDIDIIAPGVCIRSTWKGGGYNTISGTSMASPHVAGAAALYKATNSSASPAQVQTVLQSEGNLGWSDLDDPDPVKEVLLDVSDTAVFVPALVGTDAGDPTTTDPAPSVTIDSPTDQSTVGGSVSITATASDTDPGYVSKVEFYVDSVSSSTLIGTDSDSTGGWTATWDSTTVGDGTHGLIAVATDNAGGTGSASVSVVVDNIVETTKTMSVTLTAGNTVKKGPWYQTPLTVAATDSAGAVSGASVALNVYSGACGGSLVSSGSGTTGTDGTVIFTFKAKTTGTYCAAAAVTKDGYDPASAETSFSF